MEYVQTVLVQIEASKLDDARELLSELDEHRRYLQEQPGFLDMRVTRSINPQGNILLVVETRWSDDNSLVDYETAEPNAMSIIRKHERLTVPDSLQVLDMEAISAEGWRAPPPSTAETRERLALPLLIPAGIFAFAVLVIYGLSRIYLEVPNDVATPLAAAISAGILLTAWYLASHPSVPAWQVGGIVVVVLGLLLGGGLYAAIEDEGSAAETPSPTTSPTPGGPGGGLQVNMGDNFFEFQGQQNPTLSVAAGEETTISLTNTGVATHNMHVAGTDNQYGQEICDGTTDEPCSDPNILGPGDTATITFSFDQPGTYDFRCDFHTQQMTGTIQVQ